MDRYYCAAKHYNGEHIVRITSDCPLIEPQIIDKLVQNYLDTKNIDYASNNLHKRTFPRGLDVEVFSYKALETAWEEDEKPEWREHVTPYIFLNPEKFRLLPLYNVANLSNYRWTVDTKEDVDFVKNIYNYYNRDDFSWLDVLELLKNNPDWVKINQNIKQKVL